MRSIDNLLGSVIGKMMQGGQQACWVKLPFICLVAVALAFAVVVLIGPLMSNQDPSLLCNDPSNQQQLLANPSPKQEVHPLSTKQVAIPPPAAKIEEQVSVPPAKIDDAESAASSSGNASQSLLQFPSEPGTS